MFGTVSARLRHLGIAAVLVLVLVLVVAAPAALAKPDTPTGPAAIAAGSTSQSGLAVSSISSPPADAAAGDSYALTGTVVNSSGSALSGTVTVRLLKENQAPRVIGSVGVEVGAGATSAYETTVALPVGLPDGSYTLAACTPSGGEGLLSCATSRDNVEIGTPAAAPAAAPHALSARRVEACTPGAHTLSSAGDRVYPEMGNGGYTSVHSTVNLIYNAVEDKFLPGTNVVLGDKATQCLSNFSLDFERKGPESSEGPGPDMEVEAVTVNGAPATFEFVQPTYPGDPEGQNDPNPLAHEAGLETPVSETNPLPPACTPNSKEATVVEGEAATGDQCPANKLVITPATPIANGASFQVEVKYSGRPGVHTDGDGSVEGWFQSDEPAGDGSFVTTEPVGTEAWMPLNNHPSAKPTYDFNETVTKGRTAIANGELVGFSINAPEPTGNFPEGSTTWHWHMPQPIASYLVESSIGAYDLNERIGGRGVLYYEAQASGLTAEQKAKNKAIMDLQENIVEFQERFAGPFPFSSDGVIVGAPSASFEEEMETKITFNGGRISESTFNHENMHQWFGDNVSESNYNMTFFKEGLAQLSEYLLTARKAAEAKGGLETPEGEKAFEESLISRFSSNYKKTGSTWTAAPSNPTAKTLFTTATTYTRPATAYIALRRILGPENFANALKQLGRQYGGSSVKEPQLEAIFEGWMPNQSSTCEARLGTFFSEWFDTAFPATGEPAALKPALTGPGLEASPGGKTFYDTTGACRQTAPTTTASVTGAKVGTVYTDPTVTLTATPAAGGPAVAATTYSVDGAAPVAYSGPFVLKGTGEHTVTFFSTDAEGGVERSHTEEIAVNEPPVTTARLLPAPSGGEVEGPASVILTATDDSSGVASTEYALDGGSFQGYSGPIAVSALGKHELEFRSTDGDGAVETSKKLTFTVVAPKPVEPVVETVIEKVETVVEKPVPVPGPTVTVPGPTVVEKPAPACASPSLAVSVQRPLRREKGVAILRTGKVYRYTGTLTCGGQPAPEGTAVGISSVAAGKSTSHSGVAVDKGGKIDVLLRFGGKRTVVFTYGTASVQIPIETARR